jgi:hypothetical protein
VSLLYWPQVVGPVAASSPSNHDPYWSSVVMMAHFDNNFNNSSPLGSGSFTQFAGGNACTSSSVQSKFGGFSCLSATSTHGCSVSGSSYSFGTADYTVEFWIYLSTVTTAQNLIDFRNTANQATPVIYVTTGTVRLFESNADRITSGASAIAVNTWTAIALSRLSATTRLFIGGSQVGSDFADTNNSAGASMTVGTFNGANCIANGYMDELRVTKGVGRYGAAGYTPQTIAFPNQ